MWMDATFAKIFCRYHIVTNKIKTTNNAETRNISFAGLISAFNAGFL